MTIFDYAILNGDLLPGDQAKIPLSNKALFSSFGVYETVRIDRGHPFYLEEHLGRLLASAAMLEMELGVGVSTLSGWCARLIEIDPQATWTMRVLAFGAVEVGDRPVIGMWPEPSPSYPPGLYRDGAAAILYEGQRSLPACKSLNTLINYLARRAAVRAGALEGLLHHHGRLTEGARSNIFAVHQGQLITPPATDVLSGITRDVILQVMQNTPYPVREAPVPVDMSWYDELFISSTSMQVMPITQINGQGVGNGRVGPVTRMVMDRFAAHYRQVMDSGLD
ncbi:MAG: aminotransferase class IV [Anaerolineae bacterium]|nr:aminotransferase class IV [Anaerolineae bacterium]